MDRINFGSRDNMRRPMCWDNTKNYGFSTSDKTWIKLHSRGDDINLENDKNSKRSVFRFYKKLLALRNESDAVKFGRFEDITNDDGYFAYTRTLGDESILVVCNFDVAKEITGLPDGKYLLGNGGKTRRPDGKYAPYETAVYYKDKL